MRYITIIMVIAVYYFLLGTGLTLLLKDTLVTSPSEEGNSTYSLLDTTDINMTINYNEEMTLRTFPNALRIMFTFTTPKVSGLPQILVSIISFINWLLLIIFGVCVYRLVNPFAA